MDLILTLYHTAGRISEILNLKWDDVNFEQNWIRLKTRKLRGGALQEDKLPMNDTLYGILKPAKLLILWRRERDSNPRCSFHHTLA